MEKVKNSVQSIAANRPWVVPAAIVAVVFAIILGFGLALNRANSGSIDSGPAPDFRVVTGSNQPFKLSDQRGKPVLINFWASWCGPCRAEAPMLNAMWREYQKKGVAFIGIGYLDNAGDAAKFISETGMSYPTAPDDGTRVSTAYRVRQVPETYLIDKNGQIAYHLPAGITPDNEKQIRALLDKLIAQQAAK